MGREESSKLIAHIVIAHVQPVIKKPVITLIFKLKALVICSKFGLGGEIARRCHKNLGLDQKNAHQQIEQVLTSVLIFYCHLVSWCKLQIHAVGGLPDFVRVYIGYQARKILHTGTVKTDPH